MNGSIVEFDRRPSAVAFTMNALRPSPGLRPGAAFPPIAACWRGCRVDQQELAEFLDLTGLHADAVLPVLYPHVFGFRLQMAILTHPEFPLPIWRGLQIRNHLLQHQPIPTDATMKLETRVAGHRILEKGVEVDLHTTLHVDGWRMWESRNVFYYRGKFGAAEQRSSSEQPPPVPSAKVDGWRLSRGIGWRFARITGDYNGVHRWNWYARRLGFRGAFLHPQMIAGQCMARLRLPELGPRQSLGLWLKGPVYFGSEVTLCAGTRGATTEFALLVQGDPRPAILGRWHSASQALQSDRKLLATRQFLNPFSVDGLPGKRVRLS